LHPVPLHTALDHAYTEIKFLESETLQPQQVDLQLTNKSRSTDPYLSEIVQDLMSRYFPTR
jgi:hypothetical protein